MTTTIEQSNSLADLRERLKIEHAAVGAALKHSLSHAMAAGDLLIEAKDQLNKHGSWLPCLESCDISERTAQRYMRLARGRATVEANPTALSDMNMTDALEMLTVPKPVEDDDPDGVMQIAQRMLDGPFTRQDMETETKGWAKTKLMHQVNMPPIVGWCFDVTVDRLPLVLCPYDELLEAAKALAPIAGEKQALALDAETFSMRKMIAATVELQLSAMWMLGHVLNEIERREKLSDERFEKEWNLAHQAVMTRLDEQLANLAPMTDDR